MADHDKKDTKDVDHLLEEMRIKNARLQQRYEMVQEDKRHAEETGSSITNVKTVLLENPVQKTVAEEKISLYKGHKSSSGRWEDSDSDAEGNTRGSPTNFRSHERAWDRGKVVSKDGGVLGVLERGEHDNWSSKKKNQRSFQQRDNEKAPPNQRAKDFTRKPFQRGNAHVNQYKKSEFLKPVKGEFTADRPYNYASQSAEQRNSSRSEYGKRMTSWDYNNRRQYSGGRGGYADGGDRQNVNPKRPFSKQPGSRQQRDPYNKRTQWDDAGVKQNMEWSKKHDRFDNHVQYSQKDINRPGAGVLQRKNNSVQNRYVSKERTFLTDVQQKEWEEPRKHEQSGTWSDDDENSNCNTAEKTFSGLCQQPVHTLAKNFESSGLNWEPYSTTSDQNDLNGTWSNISDTGDSNCEASGQTPAFSSNVVETLSQSSSKIKDVMEASSSPYVEEERLEAAYYGGSSSETSENAENKCDNSCDDIYNEASNIDDLNTSDQVARDGDFGDENVKCVNEITVLNSSSPERNDHLVSNVDSEVCEIFNAHQPVDRAACGENVKSSDGSSEIMCDAPADKVYSDAMDGSCSTSQKESYTVDGSCSALEKESYTADGSCSTLEKESYNVDGSCSTSQKESYTVDGSCSALEKESYTVDGSCSTLQKESYTADGSCSTLEKESYTADGSCSTLEKESYTADGSCSTLEKESYTADGSCSTSQKESYTVDGSYNLQQGFLDGNCGISQRDSNAVGGSYSIFHENSDMMDGDHGISHQAVSYDQQISEQKTEASNASGNRHGSNVESDMNKLAYSDDAQKLVKGSISGKEGFGYAGVYRSGEEPNVSSMDRITEDVQHVVTNQEYDASEPHSEQKDASLEQTVTFGKDNGNCDTACEQPAVEKKMFSSGKKDTVGSCTSELGSVLCDSAGVSCFDHDTKTADEHTGTKETSDEDLRDKSPYDHSENEYEELKFYHNRKCDSPIK